MNVADKILCLCLDKTYKPIGQKTVKEAINKLCATDSRNKPSWYALDISYKKANGQYDFDQYENVFPVVWDDWIKLPIREFDFFIKSAHLKIRVPTIIVSERIVKIVLTNKKPSKRNIRIRDENICQYTGEYVPTSKGSVDHIIPRSKGGENTWQNMVWTSKKLNSNKGKKSIDECGLSLIKQPKAPSPFDAAISKNLDTKHRDWKIFIQK